MMAMMKKTEEREQAAEEHRRAQTARAIEKERKTAGNAVPEMAKLGKPEDLKRFLQAFEEEMNRYGVAEEFRVSKLTPLLDMKSKEFQSNMSNDTKKVFKEVKQGLIGLHQLSRVHYRNKWNDLKLTNEETYTEYRQRVRHLAEAWNKIEDGTLQCWIREKMIATIEEDVQRWVITRNPSTEKEAGEIADQFRSCNPKPSQQKTWGQGGSSYRGKKPRGLERPNQNTGTPASGTETKTKKPEWNDKGEPLCYGCNTYGHMKRQCSKGKQCLVIQMDEESNHKEFDVYPGTINGQPATNILIDPCSTLSLVHPKWLPAGYENKGEAWAQGLNDTKKCPTARVEVRIQGRTSRVTMAVKDDLKFDTILGLNVKHVRALLTKEEEWPPNTNGNEEESKQENSDDPSENASSPETSIQQKERQQPARQCPPRTSYVPGLTESQVQEAEESEYNTAQDELSDSITEDQPSTEAENSHEPTDSTERLGKDLPQFSDSVFVAEPKESRPKTKQRKRNRRQLEHRWGEKIPLEGGKAQLKNAQENDPTLKECRKKAKEGTDSFAYCNGILTRSWRSGRKPRVKEVVLPRQYRETTLKMAHSSPFAGHFGRTKTAQRILKNFFWPGMNRDVEDMVKQCHVCQITAKGTSQNTP